MRAAAQTIAVVDDEPKIAETVAAYLERSGYAVVCAKDGLEAQKIFAENDIDLAVLDLMLPGVSGEEICKRIRSGFYETVPADTPVIMLTAKAGEINVVRGLALGADDYVVKPFSPRELCARVEALLRRSGASGGGKNAAKIISLGDIIINYENKTTAKNGKTINFTANEFCILSLLAAQPGKVFSRDEIIAALESFRGDFEAADRAIDSHIKNIRKKLGDSPRKPKYLETVYGLGYSLKKQ